MGSGGHGQDWQTITVLASGSVTVRTAQGAAQIVGLAAATRVYRVAPTASGRLRPGLFVAVRDADVGGRTVATAVVQAPAGALVSLG